MSASPGESPRPPPPPPLPDHRPPRPAAAGCLRALSFGCGGFTVLALAVVGVVYYNLVAISVWALSYQVRTILERSEAPPGVVFEAGRVLDDFRASVKARNPSRAEWGEAAKTFAATPAAVILRLLDVQSALPRLPDLRPEERKEARETLGRLLGAAADGKVASDDLVGLAEGALPPPQKGEKGGKAAPAEPPPLTDAEALRRFLPAARKLLEERGVGPGSFELARFPPLLRRDLEASLAAARSR